MSSSNEKLQFTDKELDTIFAKFREQRQKNKVGAKLSESAIQNALDKYFRTRQSEIARKIATESEE